MPKPVKVRNVDSIQRTPLKKSFARNAYASIILYKWKMGLLRAAPDILSSFDMIS